MFKKIRKGVPFLEIKIVTQVDFDLFCHTIFATDRDMIPNGLIEVML